MTPTQPRPLSMAERVILALLVAAAVTLFGLWMRASDLLGFVSTLIAVTASQSLVSHLRGPRLGAPTAAAARLQPLVDVLGQLPGGGFVGRPIFRNGVTALGIGFVVATGEQVVSALLFSQAPMAPLWRGVTAMILVLLPVHVALGFARSKQQYAGTKFAVDMLTAARQVINPNGNPEAKAFASLPPAARVAGLATVRTASTVVGRITVQLLLPLIFSTPLSIAALVVATVALIAGWPVWVSLGRRSLATQTEVSA